MHEFYRNLIWGAHCKGEKGAEKSEGEGEERTAEEGGEVYEAREKGESADAVGSRQSVRECRGREGEIPREKELERGREEKLEREGGRRERRGIERVSEREREGQRKRILKWDESKQPMMSSVGPLICYLVVTHGRTFLVLMIEIPQRAREEIKQGFCRIKCI